eukprot:4621956-Pyramimonas_sp.AAC.1
MEVQMDLETAFGMIERKGSHSGARPDCGGATRRNALHRSGHPRQRARQEIDYSYGGPAGRRRGPRAVRRLLRPPDIAARAEPRPFK